MGAAPRTGVGAAPKTGFGVAPREGVDAGPMDGKGTFNINNFNSGVGTAPGGGGTAPRGVEEVSNHGRAGGVALAGWQGGRVSAQGGALAPPVGRAPPAADFKHAAKVSSHLTPLPPEDESLTCRHLAMENLAVDSATF